MMDLDRLIEQYVIDIDSPKTSILLNKKEAAWTNDKVMSLDEGIKYLIKNNMTITVNPYSRNEELLLTYIANSGLPEDNIIVS